MKKIYLLSKPFLVYIFLIFFNSCQKRIEQVQKKQEKIINEGTSKNSVFGDNFPNLNLKKEITNQKTVFKKQCIQPNRNEVISQQKLKEEAKDIKHSIEIKENNLAVIDTNAQLFAYQEFEQPNPVIELPSKDLLNEETISKRRTKSGGPEFGERRMKGIEQMAQYRRDITMPIGATKSEYKSGYLMDEYSKAVKNKNVFQPSERIQAYSTAAVVFKERGPANVPGRTRASIVSPTNPDKWYLGTVGGGVWITQDAGKTWRNTTDYAVPNLATSTLTVSPNNPNVIYAGTGEPFGNLDRIAGIGIFKSTDAGETWSYLSNTSAFGDVGRLLINPNNANHLVVGTTNGVYVTTDGGITWNNTFPGTLSVNGKNVQDFAASNDFSAIYAGVNAVGVFKSTDGGVNWSQVFNAVAENRQLGRIELDVSPVDNSRVILGIYGNNTTNFYKSDDAGGSFSSLSFGSGYSNNILADQGWYDNVLRCHPFNKDIFYAGGVYLSKVEINNAFNTYSVASIAAGYNTSQINRYVHVDQHDVTVQKSPTDPTKFRLILTNDGGVYSTDYKTNPGETVNDWSQTATGLNSTQFYGADKKKGEDVYVAGAQDNGSIASTSNPSDKNTTYKSILGGDGFEAIWNYGDPNKILVSSQYSNIGRYLNGINGSGALSNHAEQGSVGSPFYSKLANANNNPDVVFSPAKSGVWKSTDFGGTWNLTPITLGWLGTASYVNVSVSVVNPNIVWAGAAMSSTANSVYKLKLSKDNGDSFADTTGSLPAAFAGNYYISGLETSKISESRVFVTFSAAGKAKILKSDDFGTTFTDITGFAQGQNRGFPDVPVHSVLEMPFDANIIWAGTDIGLFETLDGGITWKIVPGIPPVSIWKMKIVDNQVVMATHGRGVWTATVPELSNYVMPDYVQPPVITRTNQLGIYDMKAALTYTFTSPKISAVKIFVDNIYVTTVSNLSPNTTYTYTTTTPLAEGNHTLSIVGIYTNNQETVKVSKPVEIIAFKAAASNVTINTFTTGDVFNSNNSFVIDNVSSKFQYNVLNNVGHPYANNTTYQSYLKTPINIDATSILKLKHIAVTEGGYDFAIVEVSKDLISWTEVAKFDENSYSNWKGVATANVNEGLFQTSSINLPSKLTIGDRVVVRFRLKTDPADNAFGWAIKSINETALAVTETNLLNSEVTVAPNPIVDDVHIYLPNFYNDMVSINVYNATGQVISSIQQKPLNSKVVIPFKNASKGLYMVTIKGENLKKSIKIVK